MIHELKMSFTYIFNSAIRDYHIARYLVKQLSCCNDHHDIHDVYAVAVVDDTIFGHIPNSISALYNNKSNLLCKIEGPW